MRAADLFASLRGCRRVGVFGGSFDPPHLGHLLVAERVFARLALDRVVIVPAALPPHKRGRRLADGDLRMAMLEATIGSSPHILATDIELGRVGPSYTVDTLAAFREALGPEVDLFLVVGSDAVRDLPTWRSIRDIARLARIVVVKRPGHEPDGFEELAGYLDPATVRRLRDEILDVGALAISSTEVRRFVRDGLPYDAWVSPAVREIIEKHGLYRVETLAPGKGSEGSRGRKPRR